MMTPEQITYKILYKVLNHHEKQPTAKLIYIESVELKLSDITYRLFLKSIEASGYIKIWAENKDDLGEIIITPFGTQFVNEFKESIHAERDYENFSEYLDSIVKKNTLDLIRAEKSAELHLESQKRNYEVQKALANTGKFNSLSFCAKQVDFAEMELYKIREELEVRKALGMSTSNKIGSNTTTIQQQALPVTVAQALVENSEEEWEKEAKMKSLQAGTLPYIRFINDKKAELKVIEDEKKRKRIFADFVDQSKHWCNTLELFKRWIKTDRATLSDKDFLLKLRDDYEVQYSNALYYHTIYGPDDKRKEFEKIKGHIMFLQEGIIAKIDMEKGQSAEMKSDTVNTPKKEEQMPVKVLATFDYSNKDNYFFTDKNDAFKEIENELIQKDYLDAQGKWNKEKRYLVAFIHIMYNLKYLRPKINNKSEKNTRLEYRRFFEKRYKTDITQEMKPKRFPPNKLKEYKFDFHFISEIEKL